jgi:membrane protease YdiL (CAAX protease family)
VSRAWDFPLGQGRGGQMTQNFEHPLQYIRTMFLQQTNKGKNDWWRWLLTILLVVVGYVLGQLPFTFLLFKAGIASSDGQMDVAQMEAIAKTMDFEGLDMDSNLILVLLLLMFVCAMIGLWIGVTKIHKRPFRTLTTAFEKINWGKIFFSFSLWMLFSVVLETISYFMDPANYVYNFDAATFFPLLLISLTLLPIQTSFEELFMRGYLMQGISRWSVVRWIPLLITSALFGLMHLMNPEVAEFGTSIMMTYYMGVGLFLGILTLMDDSLELALGVHAATNIFGAIFVTFEKSALQTPAIFRLQEVDVTYMIPIFFVAALLFTFVCAKKYNWSDWSKVYGPVNHPTDKVAINENLEENEFINN